MGEHCWVFRACGTISKGLNDKPSKKATTQANSPCSTYLLVRAIACSFEHSYCGLAVCFKKFCLMFLAFDIINYASLFLISKPTRYKIRSWIIVIFIWTRLLNVLLVVFLLFVAPTLFLSMMNRCLPYDKKVGRGLFYCS